MSGEHKAVFSSDCSSYSGAAIADYMKMYDEQKRIRWIRNVVRKLTFCVLLGHADLRVFYGAFSGFVIVSAINFRCLSLLDLLTVVRNGLAL